MANRDVTVDASNPNKATLADNDRFMMIDSEAGPQSLKEVVWSLIKSTLKTYFDAIYPGDWTEISGTWTYASASTITVPAGAAALYQVGDRIRLKQGAGYKYYSLAAVADTLLTVDVNTDYTVANAAITNPAYSRIANPLGFPTAFNWAPTASGYSVGNGTQVAKFFRTGSIVKFWYSLVFGNTTSVSGDFKMTLPATPAINFQASADLTDAGTAGYMAFGVSSTTGGAFLFIRALDASGTYLTNGTTLSATVTHTWTTNDVIRASGEFLTT